jgi:ribosome recycling factor
MAIKEIISYQEIINKIKPEMDKTISFLEKEFTKIRTGRVNPSLVENINVDYFGQKLLLKQLAAISVSGTREILIQPWDNSYIEGIISALKKSSETIGANPIVDKDIVRITLPPLSEEYRKNLLRLISDKQEEAKITIRRWREEAWKEIQNGFREGKIREDDKFRAKDKLQDIINEYNEKIEEIGEKKKKEIKM